MAVKKIDKNKLYTLEEAIEYWNYFVDLQAEKMRKNLRNKRKNDSLIKV